MPFSNHLLPGCRQSLNFDTEESWTRKPKSRGLENRRVVDSKTEESWTRKPKSRGLENRICHRPAVNTITCKSHDVHKISFLLKNNAKIIVHVHYMWAGNKRDECPQMNSCVLTVAIPSKPPLSIGHKTKSRNNIFHPYSGLESRYSLVKNKPRMKIAPVGKKEC
ncbi:hypothetical protein AVEN_32041-1 [Araneus ventricosus]|uniref:Uncharacterized protein n=1 Tax=Araneus ventricosus TaxID=182803 RepID=A0A4Y2JV99_ARAVE|nr:hypothetical protein AVEN_32041-1 [Araneus ventricosus]